MEDFTHKHAFRGGEWADEGHFMNWEIPQTAVWRLLPACKRLVPLPQARRQALPSRIHPESVVTKDLSGSSTASMCILAEALVSPVP